ncbi:MAG: M3 family metallopeptidase [Porphyromonas sp.]|uniref:M3 family metallopeptidase n=1 Tax=Porphyromonas sp. TaxID=1924944 RepID=UPI001CAAD488|nr:M3 family metallopeptidase [Porphyromonas sp.]MBF1370863.1 M3 family metallopeptidase [Porphyromonas sp.]
MKRLIATLSLLAMLTACQTSSTKENPLLTESTLDYQAPDFSKIRPAHFIPAIEEGIRIQLAEIDSITSNTAAPTFENTVLAYEKSGRLLARATSILSGLVGADGTEELQKIDEETTPMLSAHHDALLLNEKLFARIKAVYDQRSSLQGEDLRLTEVLYDQFVHEGALLSAADKEALKKINSEIAVLQTKFTNQVNAGTKEAAVLVDKVEELDGLSEEAITRAAEAATAAGHKGKYLLEQTNTSRPGYLADLNNRDVRRRVLEASLSRCSSGDSTNTHPTITRIAALRAEKAKLLGLPNFASWALSDQMAGRPEAVERLISQLAPACRAKVAADVAELEAFAQKTEGKDFKLAAWDLDYYAERLKKAKYDLNEADLKPYLVLDSVLKNGVFYAANQLYGLTFKPRPDIPVYADGVQVYEVFDQDNTPMALFYTDYFRRPTKTGGAWMSNFVQQSTLFGTKPVIYNVCNFEAPAKGAPAFLTSSDVETLFHEFGHALHGLFASQKYETLSGTNTPRDFVEMPSQFNEHWMTDSVVLRHYARHYKTGEPMPQALIDKMKAAATYGQSYALAENLAAVTIDMAWGMLPAGQTVSDVDAFEREVLARAGLDFALVPPRYRSAYYLHVFAGGYASGYYSYLWTEVLDHNIYEWFAAHGGLTRENGQRFREMVLSRGNTAPVGTFFTNFTGLTEPDMSSLLRFRGLTK